MKKILNYNLCALLALALLFSCEDESVDAGLEAFNVENFELIQVTEAEPYVTVSLSGSAENMSEISVKITPKDQADIVASKRVKNIVVNSFNRVSLNVPFPALSVAPSGLYDITYEITSTGGEVLTDTYTVNIANTTLERCDFSSLEVPEGFTPVYLSVPNGANLPEDAKIFITGNFEQANGGSGNYSGGDPLFELTALSSECYYIFLENFDATNDYKFTRGSYDSESTDKLGNSGFESPKFDGSDKLEYTAYNWKDLPNASYPDEIPEEAIVRGKMTIIANLDDQLDVDGMYHFVPKNATSLADTAKAYKIAGTNKVAAAVDQAEGVEYVLIAGAKLDSVGKNVYGFAQSASWDGETNPTQIAVGTFAAPAFELGDKIVIVGGATPGDWGVSSGQDFTKTGEGMYEITILLKADNEYLLLPDYGQWGDKWAQGVEGDPIAGVFASQGNGGNLKSPSEEATYKIEVDFTKGFGSYQLTKQ